jgi:hypothetical protein
VFIAGPAKGMFMLASRNFSDNRPPITVPYLHHIRIYLGGKFGSLISLFHYNLVLDNYFALK